MATYILAFCALFSVVVRSAPIGRRFEQNSSEETECGSDEDFYRNPSEVLGARFSRATMTTMCESRVRFGSGSVVAKQQHTPRGCLVCDRVCARYLETVRRDRCAATAASTVVVSSLDGYCELNAAAAGPAADRGVVRSSCVCLYKVQSDTTIDVAQFAFDVNVAGDVRVTAVESGRRSYVGAKCPSPASPPQDFERFPEGGLG